MGNWKNLLIFSILGVMVSSCSSVKRKKNPYRPQGRAEEVVKKVTQTQKRKKSISFLRERYNLCTQLRALKSAQYEYKKLVDREKTYGYSLTKEKNYFKRIILSIGKNSRKEKDRIEKLYRKRVYCTVEEMRHLNL